VSRRCVAVVNTSRRIAGRCTSWRIGGLATLLLAAGPGPAAGADPAGPYLGRWDLTLHTPARDFSSWLDIQQEGERLRVRMVGRWGHARWLPQAAVANGRIRFVSPGNEEGRADGDMVCEGERLGTELVGTTSGPGGEAWSWHAERGPALRRPQKLRREDPIQLFNGRDIAGWTMANAAAKPWRVEDGTLVSSGGGADLQTRAEYRDFSLHIEFNFAHGSNSGVYLRGRYEVQIEDDAEPEGPSERTGGIYGFIAPIVPAQRTPGVWRAYDITLIGRRVTVVLDGITLIENEEIPGITGGALDSHEGLPGPILLQGSEMGEVAYRNIVLTPLIAAEAAAVAPTARVRRLLAAMSREEKMSVIRGAHEPPGAAQGEAGWTRGVPRLGIPDLRFADGPPGVLVHHTSTGMPSTLSMAATFSQGDAGATGALIGRDARSLGIDVILQPYINLYRDPTFERAYNTLGEDPVLTGTLAARFVRGAQAQNVMAQAKHLVAYEGGDDAEVDEQALREIYLSPFADVSRAGVASIMCAYNRINGVYACDHESLLNGILRIEDGFAGFITSDWGAAHGAEFIVHGMDMEQPGTGPSAYFALGPEPDEPAMTAEETAELQDTMSAGVPEEQRFPLPKLSDAGAPPPARRSKNLGEALAQGTVSGADLDRAVAHVLGQMERFGWLDRPPSHQVRAQAIADNARSVRRLAERGAVLLKNDGVLPLRATDMASLALIGPGALQTFAIVTGQEQSYGRAERQIGAWQALRAQGGGEGVQFAVADDMTGEPIPKQAFARLTRSSERGQASVPEDQIDFTRKLGDALPAGTRAQWDGTLMIPVDGDYEVDLQLLGATGKFSIDGRKVGDMGWWGGHGDIVFPNRDNVVPTIDGLDNVRRLVHMSSGPHAVHVDAAADGSGESVQVRLAWVTPSMRESAFTAAVELARRCRVAVIFAWSRNRPFFGLPGDQDRLIEAVAKVNPNTVVVLNTGQALAMPWLNDVRAVLEMWYTGDEGGWAAANLLTGRANPGGRLPITWPAHLGDYATMDPRYPQRWSRGVDGRTVYDEGVYVGYRWFDHEGIEPLFPFGYGLSYTTFAYSDLRLARSADGGVTVRCRVRNSGKRDGDAVVQVYLGAPAPAPTGVDFPVHALAAFSRVRIAAGGTRQVRLHVAPERLQYWSLADNAWHGARAGRTVYVGASSRDLPLSAPISQDGADSVDR
jgi:beta-glucosidase